MKLGHKPGRKNLLYKCNCSSLIRSFKIIPTSYKGLIEFAKINKIKNNETAVAVEEKYTPRSYFTTNVLHVKRVRSRYEAALHCYCRRQKSNIKSTQA